LSVKCEKLHELHRQELAEADVIQVALQQQRWTRRGAAFRPDAR